ncbi:uncharacterized protein LOC131663564 [Phymastichus coffea]|uniref:uncharacterized protein LOC131663564 n=1 Tax=Phymastichus coffea TaxID=108790 RepID=UPI00273BF347|nr:uncharacterized protein LOC131663564 [Phymastichus coffea]
MAEEISRPMKYPYTLSAKIAQFPFKYYYDNSWVFKYSAFAFILCIPIFYKIQKMSYSPENVKKWQETRRKEFSGEH